MAAKVGNVLTPNQASAGRALQSTEGFGAWNCMLDYHTSGKVVATKTTSDTSCAILLNPRAKVTAEDTITVYAQMERITTPLTSCAIWFRDADSKAVAPGQQVLRETDETGIRTGMLTVIVPAGAATVAVYTYGTGGPPGSQHAVHRLGVWRGEGGRWGMPGTLIEGLQDPGIQSPVWRRLPDHLRASDSSGALAAFIEGVEDPLHPQRRFLDGASAKAAGVCTPVHPASIPADRLDWLARLLGADVTGLTEVQARWYLARRARSSKGSRDGITDAIAATLTGSRSVHIDHPSLWAIDVTVPTTDIVDITITQDAAARHTPAGTTVTVTPASPVTLSEINARYASLAAIAATGKTLNQLRFG